MMRFYSLYIFLFLGLSTSQNIQATSYNSLGQTGLINLPSAEVHQAQSIYLTFNRSPYIKIGTITVTPFDWMEASYFYYRPDDLLWGGVKGLYLDKGFNMKLSYKPKSLYLPRFAIGLDDFAGTGQFTREYIATTYNFNNIKLTTGIGWGKYVGESKIKNPLSILRKEFETRSSNSENLSLGGSLSTDLWFRGPATIFSGIEINLPKVKGLSLKMETDPFNYFNFGCCGEGKSRESLILRTKESDVNFGLSYKYKDYGNIDFSYVKGNAWNLIFSIGFSSKKPHRKKNKFNPDIRKNKFNQNKKNGFYLDLLENLNRNKLYLQTADVKGSSLSITIESAEHFNPIIYSSRAAYIAKEVSLSNNFDFNKIEVGHLNRGLKINSISYKTNDLDLINRYPDVLVKRHTKITDSNNKSHKKHEFKPMVNFPIFINNISPDIRSHVGSPERFLYLGLGLKLTTEIQINRNLVIHSTIGRSFKDNFGKKTSTPNSVLELVRTEIVDYLKNSSDDFYISNLDIEQIWSPYNNLFAKVSFGYLESMYGGLATELVYKPFGSNFAVGVEYNEVKKRFYDQRFSFMDYKVSTRHTNVAYYHPSSNILTKWSYGRYLAKDKGYTLDLSRRMPSGWRAGFFFSNTNVSAQQFGEGSFDKGFYFHFPMNIFSKGYTKDISGFSMRTMTRDGAQKLELQNRLIDSFYGSTYQEINENWSNYLD